MLNTLRAVFRPSAPSAQPAPCAQALPAAELEPVAPPRPARIPPHMRHIDRSIEETLSIYQSTRIVHAADTGLATIERRRRHAA